MKAIEFVAQAGSGKVIDIPREYQDQVTGEFRVILLLNATEEPKVKRKRVFKAVGIKTKGYKFNRDEIYDE